MKTRKKVGLVLACIPILSSLGVIAYSAPIPFLISIGAVAYIVLTVTLLGD